MKRKLIAIVLLLLTACRPEPTPRPLPTLPPSPTTLRVESLERTPPAAPTPAPCPAESGPNLRYDLNAVVDMSMYTVRAGEVVRFRNETGEALRELVFNVEPNRQPGVFSLIDLALTEGGEAAAYELTGPKLTVTLAEPLGGNCTVALEMHFVLAPLPIPAAGRRGRADHVGFSQRQFNLGHWFPVLPGYDPEEGWLFHTAYGTGEHYAQPVADFNVEVTVEEAEAPQVVGPGVVSKLDEDTWRFALSGGRDMALSVSQSYERLSSRTESGLRLEVYYFDGGSEGDRQAALHALDVGVGALARFEQMYGPPPFDRMVVVASDFPDGMEFSGLVFVGEEYFRYYSGSPAAWLTLITAHELSHQWWYALVGSDQALEPWQDEALATYSELVYLEDAYPDILNWWWDFRIASYNPAGKLGVPIYSFKSRRDYINTNYLLGVMMMQDMRTALGDEPFFAWLRAYAEANAGRLAKPEDLWRALPEGADRDAVDLILAEYGLKEGN